MISGELGRSRTACRQAWIRFFEKKSTASPRSSKASSSSSGAGAAGAEDDDDDEAEEDDDDSEADEVAPRDRTGRTAWSEEEEALLVAAVGVERAKNKAPSSSSSSSAAKSSSADSTDATISWLAVAAAVPGRMASECFAKWEKTNFGATEDGVQWTEDERDKLVAAVSEQDADVWAGKALHPCVLLRC
jgi:hypothetical protein